MANTQSNEQPHPDHYMPDLNPDYLAGRNAGPGSPHPSDLGLTAADVKRLRAELPDLDDADLRNIPLVPPGSRLAQGATYVDLADPDRQPFTAMGDMSAGRRSALVRKGEVDYLLWNRLTGVNQPERLDQPGE